jgi:hypothetical protein
VKIHPAAELFPMLGDAELAELAADSKSNGLRLPIVMLDGAVLDGRNRLKACKLAGVDPTFVQHDGSNPWRAVWSLNKERRHIEDKMRWALIGAEMVQQSDAWEAKRATARADVTRAKSEAGKKAQALQAHDHRGRMLPAVASHEANAGRQYTAEDAAKKTAASLAAEVGVSRPTMERALELKRKNQVAAERVKRGEVAGAKALRETKQAEARAKVEAQAKVAPERAILHISDAVKFLDSLGPHSIDLLLTDPPYSTDVDDITQFAWWLKSATTRIKPTGRAYICVGAYSLELLSYLECLRNAQWLNKSQVLAWTYRNTIGPSPSHDYKLNWQAVLYLRGRDAPPLDCPVMVEQFAVQDINAPDGRLGDRYHAWQKPDELAERFVRHASRPGDLVVDPFAGTGTFLLAAARLGRRAVGCDISEDNIRIAVQRGCLVEQKAARCA